MILIVRIDSSVSIRYYLFKVNLLVSKLLFGFLLSILLLWPISAQAFTTPPVYEITPGIGLSPALKGLTFFFKDFSLEYNGGKIILSSKPDGTGATVVDDAIEITVTRPDGTKVRYTYDYSGGCGFNQLFPQNPVDINNYFQPGVNSVRARLYDICGIDKYASSLYLVTGLSEIPETPPQPFLDLPWDYGNKNFKQVVYDPNSWFDHKYPLQNFECCIQSIVDYTGQLKSLPYKSHSGYDYGIRHGIGKDTLVLAAAAGTATFLPEAITKGAGNMIKIDHINGYQTWYGHLRKEETDTPADHQLIVYEVGKSEKVTKGQKIGLVGLSGKSTGYHIHFSVFKDINNNGSFADDGLLGLMDPLGWEGDYTDPWEEYSQGDKRGAKSYKLFTELTPPTTQQLPPPGGTITKEEFTLNVPNNAAGENLLYKIDFGPFEKAGETIKSIVPTIFLFATNNLGQIITNFNNPLLLLYDYSKADLSNINEDSLSFYYFNEETSSWEKILSSLDKADKTISANTTHFSQFAIMGELLDSTPATTSAQIAGTRGNDNWYLSDVSVNLVAQDNPGGKGVNYTVYSLDGENWKEYSQPLVFNTERLHKISFLTHDLAGNEEPIKTVEFSIDKTLPAITAQATVNGETYLPNSWVNQDVMVTFSCTDDHSGVESFSDPIILTTEGEDQAAKGVCTDKAGNTSEFKFSGINIDKTAPIINLSTDPDILWPPNNKLVDVKLSGEILETNLHLSNFSLEDEYDQIEPDISDLNQTIKLEASRKGSDKDGRVYTLKAKAQDLAGNSSEKIVTIIVPHDKRK